MPPDADGGCAWLRTPGSRRLLEALKDVASIGQHARARERRIARGGRAVAPAPEEEA